MAYALQPETGHKAPQRRLAAFRVTHHLLAHLLRLPKGCEIVALDARAGWDGEELGVTVACGEFPVVPEGAQLPVVSPILSRVETQQGDVVVFEGWHGL